MEYGILSQTFITKLFPLFKDFGLVLFMCCCCYGGYCIMRMQVTEGTERIKWAVVGYIIVSLMLGFVQLIDSIAESLKW